MMWNSTMIGGYVPFAKESCDVMTNTNGDCSGPSSFPKAMTMCGLKDTVSNDLTQHRNWPPESLKGVERVYKYPNYYGYGTANEFGYGEPFYVRVEDY